MKTALTTSLCVSFVASALGLLLGSSAFAQEKPVELSICLKGFSVPNLYFFRDINSSSDYKDLGAILDGKSVNTSVPDSMSRFGLNFCGLSSENTFAVFEKESGGKVSFGGWKVGGEGLWVHVDNQVSPATITVGPPEALASISGFNIKDKCFFPDSLNPYVYTLKAFPLTDLQTVYQLQPGDFSKGVIYRDYDTEGKQSAGDRLTFDAKTGAATMKYGFAEGEVFESCFFGIPVNVAKCKAIAMDVEGDGSKNNFFIIVHDASGEQHLLLKTCLTRQGWQEIGVSLEPYFESPKQMQRFITHWDGDENQKIDFPIKAVAIGVAKHGKRVKDGGQVRFRNVRFTE